ncbi:MAG: hypothetical protein AAF907_00835 [Planctomycetota bacterium]
MAVTPKAATPTPAVDAVGTRVRFTHFGRFPAGRQAAAALPLLR